MERLDELKTKYQAVLSTIQQKGVRLENLHVQDNKLFLKGRAPSQAVKNLLWDQIKIVNPNLDDITADISVDASLAPPPSAGGVAPSQTYTVRAGDTLSKISQQFYRNANQYMKIFEANRDQLENPDKIKPGQVLKIPN